MVLYTKLIIMLCGVSSSSQPQSSQQGSSIQSSSFFRRGVKDEPRQLPTSTVAPVNSSNSSNQSVSVQWRAETLDSLQAVLTDTLQDSLVADAYSLSNASMYVMSGLMEAFMHKMELQPLEKVCLNSSIYNLTPSIIEEGQDIVDSIKALMKDGGAAPGKQKSEKVSEQVSSIVHMDSGSKITVFLALSAQIMRNCVHSGAAEMLESTGRHIINAQYIGSRVIANGVDIARGLGDTIWDFEERHFYRFGKDIGTLLRKILLSNIGGSAYGPPEGVPSQDDIQKVTEGLLRGLFVPGSWLNATDTIYPNAHIGFDLQKCIAGNPAFADGIWSDMWKLFAQLSLNQEQHGLGTLLNVTPLSHAPQFSQPKWVGELLVVLLKFPRAMTRCGIPMSTQRQFKQAIRSLRYMYMNVYLPDDRVEATDKVKKAVEAWTEWDFMAFGAQLGLLLREVMMLNFPRDYSIVRASRLRKELSSLSIQDALPGIQVYKQTRSTFAAIVAASVFTVVVALLALQRIRSTSQDVGGDEALFPNMKDGVFALE